MFTGARQCRQRSLRVNTAAAGVLCGLIQFGGLFAGVKLADIFCPAKLFKDADCDPVHVELIPLCAMTRRGRECVVVIMPALAKGEDRNEPIVGRKIAGVVWAFSVNMRERINKPCRVPTNNDAGGYAPDHHRPATDSKQNKRRNNDRHVEKP